MNNLSLNFFGEKVDIKIPESLANLRQSISEKFLFSPSEAAEILITYGKDLGKKIIQTEKDFEDFIKKKIFNIDLDVDPKSQIFQKSLLKLQTESEENKIKLEVILKEMEEIKKQKKAKQDEAKSVVEFINLILRNENQLNLDIIKYCIGIIADYCKVYGKNIKPILNPGLIRDCIEKFKKSEENMGDEQMREFITWAQNCITNVIISN